MLLQYCCIGHLFVPDISAYTLCVKYNIFDRNIGCMNEALGEPTENRRRRIYYS